MKLFLLLLLCAVMFGQSSELRLGGARVKAGTILRARPDVNSPAIFQLQQGAAIRTIEGQARGSFVRVVGERGPVGWVPVEVVEVVSAPAPAECPKNDEANRKKASGGGQVAILDFNDLLRMQTQAERLAGMGREISTEERAKVTTLQSARIGGFLAARPDAPRLAGTCTSGSPDDWLLNITSDANSKAFSGMIGRIPAFRRNPKWSLDKLKTVWTRQYPVLVTGVLFYDSAALVNDDAANPIAGQLPRSWLWELRQISSILVCTGGACEPGSSKGWISLDQVN